MVVFSAQAVLPESNGSSRAKVRRCAGFFTACGASQTFCKLFYEEGCTGEMFAVIFAPLLKESNGLVVQSVRMPPCHGGGRGFESRPVRKGPSEMLGPFFVMVHYVYLLQSETDASFYIGYSTDIKRRLTEHNEGRSAYTARKIPWKLVYWEEFEDKTTALRRELFLKKQKNRAFYAKLATDFPLEKIIAMVG